MIKKIQVKIECDEMWSFIKNKKNKQWIWIAINKENREIIGLYIESYEIIYLKEKHSAVGKHTGLTNYVERLNNTFRQRCSKLVRKALSFSKKIENHIAAVWYFAHHYNAALRI